MKTEDVIGVILFVVFVIGFAAICFSIASWTCGNRWEDSGMPSRWKFGSGCQVQYQGKWIPENRYRVVED